MTNKTKGIIAITLSAFGFALMALFVRLCDDFGDPVSAFQKGFFRNVVALVIALAVFLNEKVKAGGPSFAKATEGKQGQQRSCQFHSSTSTLNFNSLSLLLLRATLGTAGIFANFYALSHITIAEGQALNKTAPFFTVFCAWIFLGERASRRQVVSLVLAFVGVILVAKPGFAGSAAFPLAMGLLGGICAGGAYACVRALRQRAVDPAIIVLFFSAFSCLVSVPFMVAGFDPMTWRQFLVLVGAGAGAAIGQFGITLAYGFAAPREIAVYDYSNIIFTAAFGFLFFYQVPDVWSLMGFGVLSLAAYRLFR